MAHGFVERDQPVASAPVIWLGVRLARANRMLDELRIDARPTMSGEHTPRLHQAASKALTRLGRLSGVGVLTVVAHQNLVRAEGVPGCGLGGLGSSHSAPMTGVANRASSPNTVTTHTKTKLHPHMATFEVSCVSGP